MDNINWKYLLIVLYQNNLEINSCLIMKDDLISLDNISLQTLLTDVSTSIIFDSIKKTPNNSSPTDCTGWDNINLLMMDDIIYKNVLISKTEINNSGLSVGEYIFQTYTNMLLTDTNEGNIITP